MSDCLSEVKDLDRKRVAQAWKAHRAGLPVEGELSDIVYAMDHHTEWSAIWDNLATAQDSGLEIVENGRPINPLLHVIMDSIVKRQIDATALKEITCVYNLLESQGFEQFEAIHVIARALVGEMWEIMKHHREFDPDRYATKANEYARDEIRRRGKAKRHSK